MPITACYIIRCNRFLIMQCMRNSEKYSYTVKQQGGLLPVHQLNRIGLYVYRSRHRLATKELCDRPIPWQVSYRNINFSLKLQKNKWTTYPRGECSVCLAWIALKNKSSQSPRIPPSRKIWPGPEVRSRITSKI